MTTSILKVGSTSYDQTGRKNSALILDGYTAWDLDGDGSLEFHEYAAGYQPLFTGAAQVTYTDAGGTLRFAGDIVGVEPSWSDEGRTWGYRCLGLKYRANLLPVVGVDGANTMAFNLNLTDEYYIAANAGKSVGDILAAVFAQHATALTAIGVTTDSTTAGQFATFTLVPQNPVYIQGERFIDAVQWFINQYAGFVRLVIRPDGLVRLVDTTAGAGHTLTLGVDPVEPPLFGRDWSTCATRVVTRGKGKIYPAVVSLLNATLVPAWTNAQQLAWSMADFEKPGDAYDTGVVTTTGGPTSITVQSSNALTAWATNFWSARQAWVYLQKTSGSGLTYSEARPVTACAAMTAGGTATLTLGLNLDNSTSTAWDTYTLIGKSADLSSGRDNVYRLLNVVTPGNWIEKHLVSLFPQPVPFIGLNNASAQLVSVPTCFISYQAGSSVPATFRIIPSTGQILFDRPYVESINQVADLQAGGTHVVQPDDLVCLLAYSRGALEAPYPPDSGGPVYSGTAYTGAGLQRTLYADVDSWVYEGNQATMVSLAQMIQTQRRDTIVTGVVRYKGEYTTILDVGTGHKLSIASNCGTTGDESLAVPVRSVDVRFKYSGGGLLTTTTMAVSSRRDPRTSAGQYMHLSAFGTGIGAIQQTMTVPGAVFDGGGGGEGSGEGFGGFGGFGAPGQNTYQRGAGRASRTIGKKSSTPASRAADAAQHQKDLEAARQAGTTKAKEGSSARLMARAEGQAKSADHVRELQAARQAGTTKAKDRAMNRLKARAAGKAKFAQHQRDLQQARKDSDTKGMLSDAGFSGVPLPPKDDES